MNALAKEKGWCFDPQSGDLYLLGSYFIFLEDFLKAAPCGNELFDSLGERMLSLSERERANARIYLTTDDAALLIAADKLCPNEFFGVLRNKEIKAIMATVKFEQLRGETTVMIHDMSDTTKIVTSTDGFSMSHTITNA